MTPNIAFRVDCGHHIGTGHTIRCLNLAKRLKKKGARVFFITFPHPGNLNQLIRAQGFDLFELKQEIKANTSDYYYSSWLGTDWKSDAKQCFHILKEQNATILALDHYGLIEDWQREISTQIEKLVVFDDLAEKPIYADIVINSNYQPSLSYDGLLVKNTKLLFGPEYALLSDDFIYHKKHLKRDSDVHQILVFMGGSDAANMTEKVIDTFSSSSFHLFKFDIVIGSAHLHKTQITRKIDSLQNFNLHVQIDNMSELISNSDLGIGAGGIAVWERAYLGLPTLTYIVADNQREAVESLARDKMLINMGMHQDFSKKVLSKNFQYCIENQDYLNLLSVNSMNLFSDNIGTEIIAQHLI